MSQSASLNLHLHPKQGEALNTPATEVLYGGAAGGGKSHLMRVAAIIWCAAIPGLQVYIFRRIRDDLIKNHMEGPKGFRSLLAPWVGCGLAVIVEDEIRFWNGSKIYLCHCKDAKDVYKYQGAEIHVLLIDELTHFTEAMYRFLRSRVRMVGIVVPAQYRGRFPRILCGSNPGNVGHLWVKSTFVIAAPEMEVRRASPADGGMLRQFIPARLDDNPSMALDDPGYEAKLAGLGSEMLVRAMRYGDWDVIEGAFFDGWDRERHVVKPFDLDPRATRIRSFDWGFAKPFSVGWFAVLSEPVQAGNVYLPRGCLVRYREWYGAKEPDVGLRMEAEDIARGILAREKGETISRAVADTQIFARDGKAYGYAGPTIAERMAVTGVPWLPADKSRVQGWDQVRARLAGDADGNPMVVVFDTCLDLIRTLPVMQHDVLDPEDLETDAEDHAVDEFRYALMSRPWARPAPQPDRPIVDTSRMTLHQVVRNTERLRTRDTGRI